MYLSLCLYVLLFIYFSIYLCLSSLIYLSDLNFLLALSLICFFSLVLLFVCLYSCLYLFLLSVYLSYYIALSLSHFIHLPVCLHMTFPLFFCQSVCLSMYVFSSTFYSSPLLLYLFHYPFSSTHSPPPFSHPFSLYLYLLHPNLLSIVSSIHSPYPLIPYSYLIFSSLPFPFSLPFTSSPFSSPLPLSVDIHPSNFSLLLLLPSVSWLSIPFPSYCPLNSCLAPIHPCLVPIALLFTSFIPVQCFPNLPPSFLFLPLPLSFFRNSILFHPFPSCF